MLRQYVFDHIVKEKKILAQVFLLSLILINVFFLSKKNNILLGWCLFFRFEYLYFIGFTPPNPYVY
jgi:hypothetical protein